MLSVRNIVEKGHAQRKKFGLKLRQPLSSATVNGLKEPISEEFHYLILEELNIKKIIWGSKTGDLEITLDTNISKRLRSEGKARELIRRIQRERKQLGMRVSEPITVTVEDYPKEFVEEIKKKTLAVEIKKGKKFLVKKSM